MLNPTPSLPPPFDAIELLIAIDFSLHIDEGTPRVAWVDRGVGLDKVLVHRCREARPSGARER